jgi:hypothetical protein
MLEIMKLEVLYCPKLGKMKKKKKKKKKSKSKKSQNLHSIE